MSRSRLLGQLDDSLAREVRALMARLEAHDPISASNSFSVSSLVEKMARICDMSEPHAQRLALAALLHDIGKLDISQGMLEWPGDLDDKQWQVVRGHVNGISLLSPELQAFLGDDVMVIANHHPDYLQHDDVETNGLSAEQIVGVASAYVAMRNTAHYRDAIPKQRVEEILDEEVGRFWSPASVKLLLTAESAGETHHVVKRTFSLPHFAMPHLPQVRLPKFGLMREHMPHKPVIVSPISSGRARALWNSQRARVLIPVCACLVLALVLGVLLQSNKRPVNAAASDTDSTLAGDNDSSAFPSFDGQTFSTNAFVDDQTTTTFIAPDGTIITDPSVDPTSPTTRRAGTTATTKGSGSTSPTTAPTTQTTPTTAPRPNPPGNPVVVHLRYCTVFIQEGTYSDHGVTKSWARAWIRQGDNCGQVRTKITTSKDGAHDSGTQTLGSAQSIDSYVSGLGTLENNEKSYNYVKGADGGCDRIVLHMDRSYETVHDQQYCPFNQ